MYYVGRYNSEIAQLKVAFYFLLGPYKCNLNLNRIFAWIY